MVCLEKVNIDGVKKDKAPRRLVNFVSSSGSGTGKTTLLLTIARGAIAEGKSVLFLFPNERAANWFKRYRMQQDIDGALVGWSTRYNFDSWMMSLDVDLILIDDEQHHETGLRQYFDEHYLPNRAHVALVVA